MSNLAVLHSNCIEYDFDLKRMRCKNKFDILSSIGAKLIKGTLKSKMKKYFDNLERELVEFVLKPQNINDLMWFSDDNNEKKRILLEN